MHPSAADNLSEYIEKKIYSKKLHIADNRFSPIFTSSCGVFLSDSKSRVSNDLRIRVLPSAP